MEKNDDKPSDDSLDADIQPKESDEVHNDDANMVLRGLVLRPRVRKPNKNNTYNHSCCCYYCCYIARQIPIAIRVSSGTQACSVGTQGQRRP